MVAILHGFLASISPPLKYSACTELQMEGSKPIEMVELKAWTGGRVGGSRAGYTPPEVLPRLVTEEEQDIEEKSTNFKGYLAGPGSPSISTLTSDEAMHLGKEHEFGEVQKDVELNTSCSVHETFRCRRNSCGEVDVITAQLRRALGVTANSSDIGDEDNCALTITDSIPNLTWGLQTCEEVFRACLGAASVDVDELRRIVWAHGVPDRPWARPVAWKLLVGYLPPDRVDWDSELAARRAEYWGLVSELAVDPESKSVDGDHPLSDARDSLWKEFFKDSELRARIEKDAVRTHPDIHRFAKLRDSLQRILFVYAKRSPSNSYRQGMNELAAPLMLVISEAPFEDLSDAEADTYFCFDAIMREMASCYAVDETSTAGIGKQLRELQALLRIKDPQLESHLSKCGVDPQFYALRWLRLWLCQEFNLPETLRIWDSLLTAELTLPWLRYVCVAMIIRIRDELLATDFAGCMKLLLH